MFDSRTYVRNVVSSETHNHFQQVSGSLIKTHPASIFIRFDKGSELEKAIFSPVPKMKVRVGWWRDDYHCSAHIDEREVTVLQVLLSHDSSYVCEVVVHYQKGDEQYVEEKE